MKGIKVRITDRLRREAVSAAMRTGNPVAALARGAAAQWVGRPVATRIGDNFDAPLAAYDSDGDDDPIVLAVVHRDGVHLMGWAFGFMAKDRDYHQGDAYRMPLAALLPMWELREWARERA